MLPEKRKRVVLFFGLIYALFFVLLYYLLLFNQGLALVERADEATGKTFAVVSNESSRVIYNVKISYINVAGQKVTLEELPKLMPSAEQAVSLASLPGELKEAKVVAEAPFHVSVEKRVATQAVSKTIRLSISISAPETAIIGSAFTLTLKVCNQGDAVENVRIEEQHSLDFFPQDMNSTAIGVANGKCKTLEYRFMPAKDGETVIYFNIEAYDTIQKIEKNIRIETTQVLE